MSTNETEQNVATPDDSATSFNTPYERELFQKRYQDTPKEHSWGCVTHRVSHAVAKTRLAAELYEQSMRDGLFLPSSPQLWNFGSHKTNNENGASCFTLPLGDSLESFTTCVSNAESLFVASGGVGVLGDSVRPRGCRVAYTKNFAIGVMGDGGPFKRLEERTGYTTNGGRDRGALMEQLSAWHPDSVEFILGKKPSSLGFLDNWRKEVFTAMNTVLFGVPLDIKYRIRQVINEYACEWVYLKDWITQDFAISELVEVENLPTMAAAGFRSAIKAMIAANFLKIDDLGRMVPQVLDNGMYRNANKDWILPMQNCNMTIRVTDYMVESMLHNDGNDPHVFSWFSEESLDEGFLPWTKTDLGTGKLREIQDGRTISVDPKTNGVVEVDGGSYKYGVVITTWAGLKENMKPNPKNFKDVNYMRFYRDIILPEIERYGDGAILVKDVMDLIMRSAHGWADPGIAFSSLYEEYNTVLRELFGERFSNPCAEFLAPRNSQCLLASLNARFAMERRISADGSVSQDADFFDDTWRDQGFAYDAGWDVWDRLRKTKTFKSYLKDIRKMSRIVYRYNQDAMDFTRAPVQIVHDTFQNVFRQHGIGIMGLAEVLNLLRIPYGSELSAKVSAATMAEVQITLWEMSYDYAEKGYPKPEGWAPERIIDVFKLRIKHARDYGLLYDQIERFERLIQRTHDGGYATNTTVSAIAPNGTISMIVGWLYSLSEGDNRSVTGGAEPTYAWVTYRQDNSGSVKIEHDLWHHPSHNGKHWMIKAGDVGTAGHVAIQAAVGAFCCMGVSKTTNMDESATVQDVFNTYLNAWKHKIVSTTVYRDGCKPIQVLFDADKGGFKEVEIAEKQSCPGGICKMPMLENPEAVA